MSVRLLLSHNYNLTANEAPPLSPEAFATAFATASSEWEVRAIDHPHWRCEAIVPEDPQVLGPLLARALVAYRRQQLGGEIGYQVLALGGLKTTPATSSAPGALQQGDWGVDVVETPNSEAFLAGLGWENLIAGRPAAEIFQAIAP